MKKIIFFDSWTKGLKNIISLNEPFRKAGYQAVLIHTGSFKNEKNRPKEELINGFLVRDISYYKGNSFDKILIKENPAAVFFLSLKTPLHMAFNRYAKYLNILTCHMYHGLASIQLNDDPINTAEKKLSKLKRNLKAVYPFLRYSLPIYLISLLKTKAKLEVWTDFFFLLINQATGINFKKKVHYQDFKSDIGFVFSKADINHMNKYYGVSFNNIFAVGNPDFLRLGLKVSDIGSKLQNQNHIHKKIIYIDTGYLTLMMIKSNVEKFIEHICATKEVVEKLGFNFAIKLKPHSDFLRAQGNKLLLQRDIKICEEENFLQELKNCTAVITEQSTLSLTAAALGLNLFLPSYGLLAGQKYSSILMSYPKAIKLDSLKLLVNFDFETKFNNKEYFDKWINSNIYPLPAEKFPSRIIDIIRDKI